MNNNVTDIFQALKNLEGKISSLEKTVDDQQECICNLTRINDRLRKENRILKNRLRNMSLQTRTATTAVFLQARSV